MAEYKNLVMNVHDQYLEVTGPTSVADYHLVANSEDYVSLEVTFNSVADDSEVEVYFNRHIKKVATTSSSAIEISELDFPSEVIKTPGFSVSLIYHNDENNITTNYVFFPVYEDGIEPEGLDYDDDSYIDARIAKQAAEEALEEIDDLNASVISLNTRVSNLEDVVDTTISSLEDLTTTVNSVEDWIDYEGRRIYYSTPTTATDDYINIYTDTRIMCPGVITDNQTELTFTVPLPYRLRALTTGLSYKIRDLAISARGNNGYYRDYYAHGFRAYRPTTQLSDIYGASSIVEPHTGSNEDRKYEFYLTIGDCKVGCFGEDYPKHWKGTIDGVTKRSASIDIPASFEEQKIVKTPTLNQRGLLLCTEGSPTPIVGWDSQYSEPGQNSWTRYRSNYEITPIFRPDCITIKVRMPFSDGIPIFQPTTSTPADQWAPGMNEELTKNNCKRWIPLHPDGSWTTMTTPLGEGTGGYSPWTTIVRQHNPLNMTSIDVEVNVLTLMLVSTE